VWLSKSMSTAVNGAGIFILISPLIETIERISIYVG
jgi:hypothetical protein